MTNVTFKELALLFIMHDRGGGISPTSSIPEDWHSHVSMNVLRSLERKGLVVDNGIFNMSQEAKNIVAKSKRPLPPFDTRKAMETLRFVYQNADNPAMLKSWCKQQAKNHFGITDLGDY